MEGGVSAREKSGRLYVVSTPIGHMGDFSFRGVETLKQVAVVLAEDTRHSRALLDRYEIRTGTAAYHEHNEATMIPSVIARLEAGDDVALISDAGTPLLSDPGARLVRSAIEAGIGVVPVPGASALLAALIASGISAERFTFFGFLPRKGRERQRVLRSLVQLQHTAILYEAPGRIAATLAELAQAGAAGRWSAVARELTKRFEEIRRGTVGELATYYTSTAVRGEMVLVLAGAEQAAPDPEAVRDRARALRASGISGRDVAAQLIAEFGIARNEAYRVAKTEE